MRHPCSHVQRYLNWGQLVYQSYWTHWENGHNVCGLYRSLFSKRKEKRIKWIFCAHLFYTYLYIYFSCRLYTTSKKECTKVCYLVHYTTNSIAFACLPKGKKQSTFCLSFVCSCLHWELEMFQENCMITSKSMYKKKYIFKDDVC